MDIKHLLSISEMAKITNVSRKNLIYYDSIDLLKPELYDTNKYRYYSIKQIEQCHIIVALKELKVPLADIKKYLELRTPELGLSLFQKQLKKLDSDISSLLELRDYLNHRIETTQEYEAHDLHTPTVIACNEEYFFVDLDSYSNAVVFNTENISNFYGTLFKGGAFTNYSLGLLCTTHNKTDIHSPESYAYRFMLRSQAVNTEIPQITKKKGDYLVSYHHGDIENVETSINALIKYAKDNRLEIEETIYIENIIDEVVTKDEEAKISKLAVALKETF